MSYPKAIAAALLLLAPGARAATIPLHTETSAGWSQRVDLDVHGSRTSGELHVPWSFSADGYVDTEALTFTLTSWSFSPPTGSLTVESDPFDLAYTIEETIDPPGFDPPYTVVTQVDLQDVVYWVRADWTEGDFAPKHQSFTYAYRPDPNVAPLSPSSLDGHIFMGSLGGIHFRHFLGSDERGGSGLGAHGYLRISCVDAPSAACAMSLGIDWIHQTTGNVASHWDFLPDGSIASTRTELSAGTVPEPSLTLLLALSLAAGSRARSARRRALPTHRRT